MEATFSHARTDSCVVNQSLNSLKVSLFLWIRFVMVHFVAASVAGFLTRARVIVAFVIRYGCHC